jgi:hypothetical protein
MPKAAAVLAVTLTVGRVVCKTSDGQLLFGKHLVPPRWPTYYRRPTGGQVSDLEDLVAVNDPGFVSAASKRFPALEELAGCGRGRSLREVAKGNRLKADLTPRRQYVRDARWEPRPAVTDVGAFQHTP